MQPQIALKEGQTRGSKGTTNTTHAQPEKALLIDHPVHSTEVRFAPCETPVIWGYLAPVECAVRVGSFDQPRKRYAVGDFRLVRPGTEVLWRPSWSTVIRSLSLPREVFTQFVDPQGGAAKAALGHLERDTFRSSAIEVLSRSLAEAQSEMAPKFFMDTLAHSIVYEIWRLTRATNRKSAGGDILQGSFLKLLDEYIRDAIADHISLDDLAAVCSMPVHAFSRTFKETTGRTPYQHVMNIRVEAATDMVALTRLSLAEVAYECGFSSQSHMTDVFRSRLGISPGQMRKP